MAERDITGVILAGGLGRRMGGVDKGLQCLDGQALAMHVLARLQPQVGTVLINANRNAEAYADFGVPVIPDLIADFVGPLAGLHAALSGAKTPWVLSAPCDSPYLPLDLAKRLLAGATKAGAPLAVARSGRREHPVFCLCRVELGSSLANFLAAGQRRVLQWCLANGVAFVDFDDQPEAFRNFNLLADLAGD